MIKTILPATLLIILLFYANICLAQNNTLTHLSINTAESFAAVKDSIIKKEIGLFNLKSNALTGNKQALQEALQAIGLKRCTDSSAYFDKGSLLALDILIHINSRGTGAEASVSEVDVIYHKYMVKLPDSALAGIRDPKFCSQHTKRNIPISSACKAFRSTDRRRIYIYMLNGEGKNRYEVTWVLQDGKYLIRVIDPVE